MQNNPSVRNATASFISRTERWQHIMSILAELHQQHVRWAVLISMLATQIFKTYRTALQSSIDWRKKPVTVSCSLNAVICVTQRIIIIIIKQENDYSDARQQ